MRILLVSVLIGLLLLFGCTSTKDNHLEELNLTTNLSNVNYSAGAVLDTTFPINDDNETITANPTPFNLTTTVTNTSELNENKTETEKEATGVRFSNYVLVLDDVIQQGSTDCASISIFENSAEATLLHRGIVCPGHDYYWVSPEKRKFRIVMTSVAGGYAGNAIWANVIVYG
ncbi:MAG: hypothetical protein WCT31_02330 [Candidatus Micrarchaeia archaeon]|jgi:hypothetical protein